MDTWILTNDISSGGPPYNKIDRFHVSIYVSCYYYYCHLFIIITVTAIIIVIVIIIVVVVIVVFVIIISDTSYRAGGSSWVI